MSHRSLQHALVIALHDEAFVDAMHADPESVLGQLGLDARERTQLLAVDRRAFRTDPLRPRKLLRVLAEELPVSTALLLHETRSAASIEAFFSSPHFRAAVASRHSLAPAFGDFLASLASRTPQLADVIRLETTTARCRRAKATTPPRGISLAPGVAVGAFDAGVLETINRVERWLFELKLMPVLALCSDGPALPALPPPGAGALHLLFTPSQTGVQLTPIDEDLHRALTVFATPRPDSAGYPRGLIDSLVDENILSVV